MLRTMLGLLLVMTLTVSDAALAQVKRGEAKPMAERPYENVYVLMAGWNAYPMAQDMNYQNLQYAQNDATRLGRLFEKEYNYRVEMLPPDCTKRQALDKIEHYQRTLNPERDVFIFYVASHGEALRFKDSQGVDDEAGYIIPPGADFQTPFRAALEEERKRRAEGREKFFLTNAEARDLSHSEQIAKGMPADLVDDEAQMTEVARSKVKTKSFYDEHCLNTEELRDRIMAVPALHTILIVDACYSGFATRSARSSLATYKKFSNADVARWFRLQERSRVVLTAGTKAQLAEEWPDGKYPDHGIYTGSIIHKLEGSKNAISVSELYEAVRSDVMWITRRNGVSEMTPRRLPLDEDAEAAGEFTFIPHDATPWFAAAARAESDPAIRKIKRELRTSARGARIDAEADMLVAATTPHNAQTVRDDSIARSRWEEWFKENQARALAGDPYAMVSMYFAYSKGLGVAPDPAKAYEWANEARKSGNAAGAAALANALATGTGTSKQELIAQQMEREAKANQQAAASALVVAGSASQGGAEGAAGAAVGMAMLVSALSGSGSNDIDKAAAKLYKAQIELTSQARLPRSPGRDEQIKKLANQIRWAADALAKMNSAQMIDDVFHAKLPDLKDDLVTEVKRLEDEVDTGASDLSQIVAKIEGNADMIHALLEYRKQQLQAAK